MNTNITVRVARPEDAKYAQQIADEMESSAKARGTGIAKRSPQYLRQKMEEGKAVIATATATAATGAGAEPSWVGFCYIEAWSHGKFVANSGLIVAPEFRKTGVATQIKRRIFNLSREKYPTAKIFGLTTGLAVMKMNSELGYIPVTYSELTDDEEFWKGCQSCVNYEILMSKNRKNCMCTAMLYTPLTAEERKARDAAILAEKKQAERMLKAEKRPVPNAPNAPGLTSAIAQVYRTVSKSVGRALGQLFRRHPML